MATSQGGAPGASSSASSLAEDVSQHPSSPGSVTDLLDPFRTNAEALRLRAREMAELEAAAIEQAENATKAAKAARSTIVRKRLLASEEEYRKLAEEATAQRTKADLLATKAEDELAEAELKAKEAAAAAEATPRKNVLHMVADDLRTELSLAYRHPEVVTPHLDALTKKSLVFQNCYCQQPICSPSRNSFMSGLTPDHTRAWNFIQYHLRVISMLIRALD